MKITALAFLILVSSSSLFGQLKDFVTTDFRKADSIAQLYPRYSLKDLVGLSEKLTRPLSTEVEKFRAIYTWTCLNIENDYTLYLKNKRKREKIQDPEELKAWNKKFSAEVFKTLLEDYKTVCTGYAYVVRELALRAGLNCEIIDGYGRTAEANIGGPGIVNHSWNAVKLNNKWYLCDPTWSSGAVDTERKVFVQKYNDCYFLLDPELFIRNHYPLDTTWAFMETKPTLHEFLNRPLIYSSLFKYNITHLVPETFEFDATKKKTVSFQFRKNDNQIIENVQLSIKGPSGIYSANPLLRQDASGLTSLDYTFTAKGKYIVHVLLNNDFNFTYTVNVK